MVQRRPLVALLAIFVAALILGGAATPARAQSQIWLHIVSIQSYEIDDAVGKDEPYFKFNGSKIWQGGDFNYGHYVDLDVWVPLTSSQGVLELWEDDDWPSKDDHLSNYTIYASEVGQGVKTIDMGYMAGTSDPATWDWMVHYVVRYEVVY